jgi:hypothetical protein
VQAIKMKINLILLTTFIASVSFGKCFDQAPEQIYENTPYFIKGVVRDLKTSDVKGKPGIKEVSFKIEVVSVLKGNIKSKNLKARYEWANSKEPLRQFEDGKVYIFPTRKIAHGNATIETSTCIPDFTEDEIQKLKLAK